MNKRGRFKRLLGYLVGLVVFAALVYIGGAKSIQATFNPRPGFIVLSFLAHFMLTAIGAIRWGYIVNVMEGYPVCSYYSYFFYFTSGSFFGQYVSRTGGDLVLRPGLLNRINGVSFRRGFYAIFLEKIFDLMFIVVVLFPALLYLFQVTTGFAALLICIAALSLLLYLIIWRQAESLTLLKQLLLQSYYGLQKAPLLRKLARAEHLDKIRNLDRLELLGQRTLLNLFAMTLFRYLAVVGRLYFLVMALDLLIPLPVLFVGLPVAQLSLALSFTPGGLGVLEGGWYAVFALADVPQAERVTFLIAQRAYFFIFPSVVFLFSYLVAGTKRLLTSDAPQSQ